MQILNSETFLKIIKGDYLNSESEYSKFYITKDYSNDIVIQIKDVQVQNEIVINDNFSYPFLIEILESKFISRVNFVDGVFMKGISFRGVYFHDKVFYNGGNYQWISFAKSQFNDSIAFSDGDYNSVRFSEITVKYAGVFGGRYKSLTFEGKGINTIGVYNKDTFINSLGFFWGLLDTDIEISNITINQLYLSGSYSKNNSIEIENTELHTIKLSKFKHKGRFLFNNISLHQKPQKVSNITIAEFYKTKKITNEERAKFQSYSPIKIDESKPLYKLHLALNDPFIEEKQKLLITDGDELKETLFELDKALLGDFELKNVDLEGFKNFQIIDTDLSTVKLFNSIFPSKRIKGNSHSLYEIFNDLYTVAKKQNNKRNQIEYYKASQRALLCSLLNAKFYKNIPSIFSIGLSLIYSNYGTRWTQAFFIITPIFGVLFFCAMVLSTNYDIDYNLSHNGIENFYNLLVYYIRYLNPTHKLEFMDSVIDNYNYSTNFWFVFFDTLGRIFVSIGLFETVQSFRKYVRK